MLIRGLSRSLLLGVLSCVLAGQAWGRSRGKEILVGLSWGDQIAYAGNSGESPLLSPELFRKRFQEYRKAGVDIVLFRLDVLRWVRDYDWPEPKLAAAYKNAPPEVLDSDEKQWAGAHDAVKADLLKSIVEIAHENGLKIYAYSTTFDEGMPLDKVWHAKGDVLGRDPKTGETTYFPATMTSPAVSKFTEEHPEDVMVDRSQKHHNWGTLEFAYPQARAYAVEYNRRFLERYAFDGIYVDFRNEFSHPQFGDEFGFGQPIVDEYQRRYGINILKQQFDLEKWRRLRGEYLTQFIQELHAMVHSKGKKLIVGIPQGNYMELPNGNMYIDWQGWVKRHLVDGLNIGIITGKFLFPDKVGYGYLTDMEDDIGLPNLLWDLQNNYWPMGAQYHVKMYAGLTHGKTKISLQHFLKTNVDGLYLYDSQLPLLDKWRQNVTP